MKNKLLFQKLFLAATCLLLVPLAASADPTGPYYGSVTISTPTDMGAIDLAFYLDVDGTTIQHDTSYIILDKTMVFPAVEPQIEGRDVGPRVQGTLTPDTFSLTSDTFESMVGNATVTRQTTLNQAILNNDGQSISGTYTETVTGLLHNEDIIISGEFLLLKPVPLSSTPFEDTNEDGCLDLAEIRAGGDDSARMEFSDAGEAMLIHNGSGSTPLCAPADQTARDALQEFYDAQN